MRLVIWALWSVLSSLALMGCVRRFGADDTGGIGGNTPGISGTYALAVSVSSSWEGHPSPIVVHQACTIGLDATPPVLDVPCAVSIPQGKMFYGDLHFTLATLTACARVEFLPYYYLASNSATFTPEWNLTESIDCSASNFAKLPKDCFNGPMALFNSNFPQHYGKYFIPTQDGNAQTYDIPSANTMNRQSNRWAGNNLPVAKRLSTLSLPSGRDGFVPALDSVTGVFSFGDYRVRCYDQWDQVQYSIVVTVSDVDTSSGDVNPNNPVINHWPDWNSLLDPH